MPPLSSSPFSCAVSCFGWFTPGILNSSNFTTSASCSPSPSHSHKSFIPLLNRAYLHLSRLFSTCSQLSLPIMSSAKITVHGDYSLTSSFNPFISTANQKIIIFYLLYFRVQLLNLDIKALWITLNFLVLDGRNIDLFPPGGDITTLHRTKRLIDS